MGSYRGSFERELVQEGNSCTFEFPEEMTRAYQAKTGHPIPMFWGFFSNSDGLTHVVLYDPIQCDFLILSGEFDDKPVCLQMNRNGRMEIPSELIEKLKLNERKIVIQGYDSDIKIWPLENYIDMKKLIKKHLGIG